MIKKGKLCEVCNSSKNVRMWEKRITLCNKHYEQMRIHGKIFNRTIKDKNRIIRHDDYAEIVLTDRYLNEKARTVISIDQIEKVKHYKWYLTSNGYVGSKSNNKFTLLHRLIMNAKQDEEIDYIDRNRINNLNENLRTCTRSQNAMNTRLNSRNTSGVKGVWYCNKRKTWVADIKVNGKKYSLGSSKDKKVAIDLRKVAEKKYFKEFTPTNGGVSFE